MFWSIISFETHDVRPGLSRDECPLILMEQVYVFPCPHPAPQPLFDSLCSPRYYIRNFFVEALKFFEITVQDPKMLMDIEFFGGRWSMHQGRVEVRFEHGR